MHFPGFEMGPLKKLLFRQILKTRTAASRRRTQLVGLRQLEPVLQVIQVTSVAADEADCGQTPDGNAAEEADHAVTLTGVALWRTGEAARIIIYCCFRSRLRVLLARAFDG